MTVDLSVLTDDAADTIEISDRAVLNIQPAVSVCVQAYNHERYIARTLESVVAQKTRFPFEVIIGEDCSTDGTRTVAQAFQRQYPGLIRIVFGSKNAGMLRTLVRMLRSVRAPYVAFCEGDDWWSDPEKLQLQYEILQANPKITLCCHAVKYFDQRATKWRPRWHPTIQFGRQAKNLTLRDVVTRRGGKAVANSFFMRTHALPPVEDWFLNSPVGDYPIKIWAATHGVCHYQPRVMSVYRIGTGVSWTSRPRDPRTAWAINMKVIDLLAAMRTRIATPDADVVLGRQIGHHLRDALLEARSCSFSDFTGFERYLGYLCPGDRMLVVAGRHRFAAIVLRILIRRGNQVSDALKCFIG